MKRILLPALVLCAVLASGCKTEPNDNNANQAVNRNGGNANQTVGNTNAGAATRDPKNKAVMITVGNDAAGNPQITVSPSNIYLKKSQGQKLRFVVFDNLDDDLTSVKIDFKAEGNPMDGDYSVGAVASGTDERSPSQGIKAGSAYKKYPYKITAMINGVAAPVTLDPEIEIGN